MKARNYIFTISNYTQKMLKDLTSLAVSLDKHQYICYGLEVAPTTGTKHIQGYIQLKESQRFLFLHNYFNLTKKKELVKFHIEQAKGTFEENQVYTKKDGKWVEYGEPKAQGKRKDIDLLREKIKEDPKALKKIIYENDVGYQAMKFAENFQKYCLNDRDPNEPPKVFWIHGNAGIGKTKLVYDSFDTVCAVSNYDWLGHNYTQEECYLLDDFRKTDLSFNMLLRICDRYPISLATKGGFVPLNSPYIVITSSKSIKDTYSTLEDDLTQLTRRLVAEIDLNRTDIKNLKEVKIESVQRSGTSDF